MSVVTTHEIIAPNLMQRLRDKNLIKDELQSVNKFGQPTTYKNVLDYEACDAEMAQKYFDEDVKRIVANGGKESNVDKDKLLHMPLYETKSGNVAWSLNYFRDDRPTDFIAKQFPGEVMGYRVITEGHLDGSCYFTDKLSNCTKTGKPIESYVSGYINSNQIKDMGDGTSKVALGVTFSDKRFAYTYVNNDYLIPNDITNENPTKFAIALKSKTDPITVYRKDKNGKNIKESLTPTALNKRIAQCKSDYKNSLKAELSGIDTKNIYPILSDASMRGVKLTLDSNKPNGASILVHKNALEQQTDGTYKVSFNNKTQPIKIKTGYKDGKAVYEYMSIKDMLNKIEIAQKPRVYTPSVEADKENQDENQMQ